MIEEFLKILGTGATAAAILVAVAFFFRDLLASFLNSRNELATKKKLAELEDAMTRERSELDSIRNLIVRNAQSRNEKLVEKQILAAETLWISATRNGRHKTAAQFLRSLKIEKINEYVEEGRTQELVKSFSKMSGVDKLIEEAGQKDQKSIAEFEAARSTRPFVSPVAWALYEAHSSTVWHAVMTMIAWKSGVTTNYLNNEDLVLSITKALPHQKTFMEKFGVGGAYYLLDQLEEALLAELKRFLQTGDTDQESVKVASEIIEASRRAKIIPLQEETVA